MEGDDDDDDYDDDDDDGYDDDYDDDGEQEQPNRLMPEINVSLVGAFHRVRGVPVPVEVVDSNLKTVAEATVALDSPQRVQIEASGRYMVRASLPSGEILSTMVTIPATVPAASATAMLVPRDPSPQEDLAWAYIVQGMKRFTGLSSRPVQHLSTESKIDASSAVSIELASRWRCEGWIPDSGNWALRPEASGIRPKTPPSDEDTRILLWVGVHDTRLYYEDPTVWSPLYQAFTVSLSGESFQQLVLVPPVPPERKDVPLFDYPFWDGVDLLFVRKEVDRRFPVPVMVQGEPRADAVLSFVGQGAYENARRVATADSAADLGPPGRTDWIREAESRVREDPSGATAAGYYLLRAGGLERTDWIRTLADEFKRMPDGAIQYAWCLLHQEKPDYRAFRSYMLTAVQRGIPMYTMGLRLLYDGLNLLTRRQPEDAVVQAAFRAVRQIAALADWNSSATTFRWPSDTGAEPVARVDDDSDHGLQLAAELFAFSLRHAVIDDTLAQRALQIIITDAPSVAQRLQEFGSGMERHARESRFWGAEEYLVWSVEFSQVGDVVADSLAHLVDAYERYLQRARSSLPEWGNGDLCAQACIRALISLNRAMHPWKAPLGSRVPLAVSEVLARVFSHRPELLGRVNLWHLAAKWKLAREGQEYDPWGGKAD